MLNYQRVLLVSFNRENDEPMDLEVSYVQTKPLNSWGSLAGSTVQISIHASTLGRFVAVIL